MQHIFYDREDGWQHCKVCNGDEGSLPTDCPGTKMTAEQNEAVYAGTQNFDGGVWVTTTPNKTASCQVAETDPQRYAIVQYGPIIVSQHATPEVISEKQGYLPITDLPVCDDEFDSFVATESFNGIQHVALMKKFLLRAANRFHALDTEWRAMEGENDLPKIKMRAWAFLADQFTDKCADLSMFFRETDDFYEQSVQERLRLVKLANALVYSGRDPAKLADIAASEVAPAC